MLLQEVTTDWFLKHRVAQSDPKACAELTKPTTMVPEIVVASRAEGPASRGSVPTTAMKNMAMRPAHACLYDIKAAA